MTGAVRETVHNGRRYLITSHQTADRNGWTRFAAADGRTTGWCVLEESGDGWTPIITGRDTLRAASRALNYRTGEGVAAP